MTERTIAVASRFAIAAIGLTAIAVVQVELERRSLLVNEEQVRLADEHTAALTRLNELQVDLSQLTAPSALQEPAEPGDGDER